MGDKKSLVEILIEVGSRINVPKSRWNQFGKYNYRSAEDIWTAAKPLLAEHGVYVYASDRVENVGKFNYQVCKLSVTDDQSLSRCMWVEGWAREDDSRKGMDSPQLSGSASSYACKRAWNNLLGLDDCKDSDATNQHDYVDSEETEEEDIVFKKNAEVQLSALVSLMEDTGFNLLSESFCSFLRDKGMVNVDKIEHLTYDQASVLFENLGETVVAFYSNKSKHKEIMDEFNKIKSKEAKKKILEHMEMMIPEINNKVEYESLADGALNDYFRLYLMTIHDQEVNKIRDESQKIGLTTEEAIGAIEKLGMKPKVREKIKPKNKEFEKVDTSYL